VPFLVSTNSHDNKLRILVADDQALVRAGVATIVSKEVDMVVIAEAADGEAAVALYLQHKPDVALVDLRMPGLDGWEVIRRIKAADPNANSIVLTAHDGDEDIELSLKAGARGYLLKDVAAEELTKCIRDVKGGKIRLAAGIAARLAEKVTQVQLTVRELGVLQVLAFGKTNKEIAERLDISDGTVRVHLTNLFRKLNASTRTEAVATAIRRGLVRL